MIISSGFLHIQRLYPNNEEKIGLAMSTVVSGIICGVTFGPPLGGTLYGYSHVLPFFMLVCIIGFTILLAVVLQIWKFGTFGCCNHDSKPKSKEYSKFGVSTEDGKTERTEENARETVISLLKDIQISSTLFALFSANAAISCLESTFGIFMTEEHGMSVKQIGFLFVIGAGPSIVGSKIAGSLGNKFGRWKVVLGGMLLQGAFFALGPKSNLYVECVSLLGLGLG